MDAPTVEMATSKDDPQMSYLYRQIYLLQMVVMWPVQGRGIVKILIFLYFCLIVVSLTVSTVGTVSLIFVTSDLVVRCEAVHIFTLSASSLFKYLYFVAHRKTLLSYYTYINENFIERPIYGDADLKMASWMRYTKPLSTIHCVLGFVIISFWGFCPIIKYMCGLIPYSEISLPINVWYPYDFNHGFQFIPLYSLHFFVLLASVQIYLSVDGFFFSLIHFICGQLELIKASLSGIESITAAGEGKLNEAHYRGLSMSIEQHCKILKFMRELEVLFRPMISADALHSVVALSFAMLQASESGGIFETMKLYLFVSYSFIHQYLNSLFGQLLINKQESLLKRIYFLKWEDKSISFGKSMCFMLVCSLTPLKFSAWRMYFLQYETFVEFVKLMVSIFMLLRNIQDR